MWEVPDLAGGEPITNGFLLKPLFFWISELATQCPFPKLIIQLLDGGKITDKQVYFFLIFFCTIWVLNKSRCFYLKNKTKKY